MSSLNSVRPQRFFTLGDIMRITIRAMCQKRNELNEKILHCHFELSKMCLTVLVQSICVKIQDAISKPF